MVHKHAFLRLGSLHFNTMATSQQLPATTTPVRRCWNPTVQWDPSVEKFLRAVLGPDRLRAISASTVQPPAATCLRVNTLRTTPHSVLHRVLDALSPEDRALVASSGKQPFVHPQVANAVFVPGSGPHRVDYDVTRGLEVIVGRKAGEAMLRGSNCYAPGVLACSSGIQAGDLVAVSIGLELPGDRVGAAVGSGGFGCPRGTVFEPNLPLDDPRFPYRSRLCIGIARSEVPRTGLNPATQGLVLTMVDRVFRTPSLGEILKGEVMLQNFPSLIAALVAGPRPGQRVLDMCAAPGGKTTAMAALMENRGEIIALDRSHGKVAGIEALCAELGVKIVKAMRADSTRLTTTNSCERNAPLSLGTQELDFLEDSNARSGNTRGCDGHGNGGEASDATEQQMLSGERRRLKDLDIAKKRARQERKAQVRAKLGHAASPHTPQARNLERPLALESFDVVLLDAPCSALGLRPRLVLPQTMEELRSSALYQRRLLDQAVRLVRPGGTLVFSTW
jgi:methyltransferase NSUN6